MRNTILTTTVGVLAAGLALSALKAQEPFPTEQLFDPVRVDTTSAPPARCYIHARYIVVERELPQAVGADLFVRLLDTDCCTADSLAGDFVLRNQWAEYFYGLRGDVLFIDSGTGPDVRELILIDLRTRRRLLQRSYVELVAGLDSTTVGLWDGHALDAPAPGCESPVGGLQPGIDSLFSVDLRTGNVRFAGRIRCASRQ